MCDGGIACYESKTKLFISSEVPIFQIFSDDSGSGDGQISDHQRSVMDDLVRLSVLFSSDPTLPLPPCLPPFRSLFAPPHTPPPTRISSQTQIQPIVRANTLPRNRVSPQKQSAPPPCSAAKKKSSRSRGVVRVSWRWEVGSGRRVVGYEIDLLLTLSAVRVHTYPYLQRYSVCATAEPF